MLTIDAVIKKAYEEEHMTPAQIAYDQQLDETAVKAKLIQISSRYRKDCGKEDEEEDDLNFTKDQLRDANKVIYETALSAQLPDGSVDYRTRLQAATYIRDDKKGRKEVVKAIQGQTFNILSFNQALQGARNGAQQAIEAITSNGQKVIEV